MSSSRRTAAAARRHRRSARRDAAASRRSEPMPKSTALARYRRCRHRRRRAPAEGRAGSARPEQQSDGQAHGAAERDVLDPHAARSSSRPAAMMLNRIDQRERERRLAGGKGDRGGREPGEQDRDRQQQPQHGRVRADRSETSAAPIDEPDDRARQRRAPRSGRCSARSSAAPTASRTRPRTRAARRSDSATSTASPKRDRAAHAVVQPHRMSARRARRHARWAAVSDPGHALGLAPEQPLEPGSPRRGGGKVDVLRDCEAAKPAPGRGSSDPARR